MPKPDSTTRILIRTMIGTLIGVVASLACWIALFLIATLDDAAHWKGTLIISAILLPIFCVSGGVIITRASANRLNYAVANIGFVLLTTLLATALLTALLSLPLWMGSLIAVPTFLGLAFIEKRYISATINSWVERLAGISSN